MLTKRGVGLLVAALALFVVGRIIGTDELHMLAASLLVLAVAVLVYLSTRSISVQVDRTLHPPRVHAGNASRVELVLRNRGGSTPVLSVRDPFHRGWRWARFLVPPLSRGTATRAAYRLPTDKRGVYDIGPLEVLLSDPFGIATRRFTAAGVTQLTVYPRIDHVRSMPTSQGEDPHSGVQRPRSLLGVGEEFYALRQYEVGDDIRLVHWPSTARMDDLMIRQYEMPWQTRVTILLDVRASVHTDESLEAAVSAAASVHDAARRTQSLIRIVDTGGTDSGFAAGAAHDDAILEHLATVAASRDDRLAGVAATLRRAGNGGSLAIVTTDRAPAADLRALAGLRGRYGTVVLVLLERSSYDPSAQADRPVEVPVVTALVRVTRAEPFPVAWEQAMAAFAVRAR